MCSPELSPVLSKLYNLCLSKSVFPSSWKMASVVPVFRGSGEKSDPANYRPISLLPIISKVFESVINQHLLGFLEDHSLLTDAQFGFRHSRSTGDVLALITEHINKALDSRGEARVVALDISKAFDKVWHRGLVHKLKSYGISGKLLGTISDFLADRHITVVHEGHSSLTHSINAGDPQGSVLGPTLFLFYINDLPDRILSELAIYADDTTLFTAYRGSLSTSRSQASSTLNQDLTNVVAWGKDWLLSFNQKKSHLLSLSGSRTPTLPDICMDSVQLQELPGIRLLGLDITSNLSWDKYISDIAKRASQRLGCLYRARRYLTSSAMLHLYKATIREYCSHIWAGAPACHLSLLDRIQQRATNLVGQDLVSSLEPLSVRRSVSSLSLFYRYFHGMCAERLSLVVPPVRTFTRSTRFAASSHPCICSKGQYCEVF